MKRLHKITAVTLVTAFLFIMMCIPSYAATQYGVYGRGGFDPPFGWEYMNDNEILFLPLDVSSNGEYLGYYFLLPRDSVMYGRIIFTDNENNSSGKYGYYLQLYSKFDGSFEMSTSFQKWRSNVRNLKDVTPEWHFLSGFYNACYLICYSDNLYLDDDSPYHSYVIDSETDFYYVIDYCPYRIDPGSGYYHVTYPLQSTDTGWLYDYGYETEEEKNQAIEQSRFDEQNKIMKEGFTVLENSINNMGNKIEGAITQAVDDILNAGSDMPTLDTNNDWMNDSLTKVNEWVSSLEAFEEQMDSAEEENSENMAQAKTFLSSFFSKIPKGIIAVLTLALVMIVVVKVVGR